jgi:hypothetical protein
MVLEHLTVEENLRAGHLGEKSRAPTKIEMVYNLFPHLKALPLFFRDHTSEDVRRKKAYRCLY